jgi:SAM-dependent methyltransferase
MDPESMSSITSAPVLRAIPFERTDRIDNPAITEPFGVPRTTGRLLFDFAAMASLLKADQLAHPVLDFGAGSGWISEMCAKMGLSVVAFDIHGDLENCLALRARSDARLDSSLLRFAHGDGHDMPFDTSYFGHILCYDTMHHMHDFGRVFAEFFRVLRTGGRAIFVEPGAAHSRAPETVAFLKAQKQHDPTWIERDIVLEEMDALARVAGFRGGITIYPLPHPQSLAGYDLAEWTRFRQDKRGVRQRYTDRLAELNYLQRVVFSVER